MGLLFSSWTIESVGGRLFALYLMIAYTHQAMFQYTHTQCTHTFNHTNLCFFTILIHISSHHIYVHTRFVSPDMAGAVIVWFILSILYEGLKTLREYLIYVDMKHWKKYNHGSSNRMCRTSTNLKYDKTALIVSEDCNMPVNNKG